MGPDGRLVPGVRRVQFHLPHLLLLQRAGPRLRWNMDAVPYLGLVPIRDIHDGSFGAQSPHATRGEDETPLLSQSERPVLRARWHDRVRRLRALHPGVFGRH